MNIVTLCSILKNESAIMTEWLTHYYDMDVIFYYAMILAQMTQ